METNATASANLPQTLCEVWQRRRDQLSTAETIAEPHKNELLHILDHLIKRYGDQPEGRQKPRGVAPGELFVNQRAILVHSYLGRKDFAGIKTEEEATNRVAKVLGRLKSLELHESAQSPAAGAPMIDPGAVTPQQAAATIGKGALHNIKGLFPSLFWYRDLRARLRDANGILLDEDVEFLGKHVKRNASVPALQLLMECTNALALDYVMAAWIERVQLRYHDALSPLIYNFFHQPHRQLQAAEAFRAELANPDAEVRVHAAGMLSALGDLQDVALLTALLALPEDLVGSRERRTLLTALRRISGIEPVAPQPSNEPTEAGAISPFQTPQMRIWRGVLKPYGTVAFGFLFFAVTLVAAVLPIFVVCLITIRSEAFFNGTRWWETLSFPLLLWMFYFTYAMCGTWRPQCVAAIFHPRPLWIWLFRGLAVFYGVLTAAVVIDYSRTGIPPYDSFAYVYQSYGLQDILFCVLPVATVAALVNIYAQEALFRRYCDMSAWNMNAPRPKQAGPAEQLPEAIQA